MNNIPHLIICLLDKDQANCPTPVSYSSLQRLASETNDHFLHTFPTHKFTDTIHPTIKLALVCKWGNRPAKEDVPIKLLAFAKIRMVAESNFARSINIPFFQVLLLIIPIAGLRNIRFLDYYLGFSFRLSELSSSETYSCVAPYTGVTSQGKHVNSKSDIDRPALENHLNCL